MISIMLTLYNYMYIVHSACHFYLWDITLMFCEICFNPSWICEYLYIFTIFYVDVRFVWIFKLKSIEATCYVFYRCILDYGRNWCVFCTELLFPNLPMSFSFSISFPRKNIKTEMVLVFTYRFWPFSPLLAVHYFLHEFF
jgi:hypothetical protein